MTKEFIPLTNLDELTEQQKQDYYLKVCEHFNIPYNLNLLAYYWLDSGDGGKHLVLYAKKGATDIIRQNLNITTKELKADYIDGAVIYTAIGEKDGRVEMAVGAADIKGKVGKALCNAIMLAQTRATRRMTLQFAGAGLLDETEVGQTTTDINMVSTPLSDIAAQPPIPAPNPTAPKDISKESLDRKDFEDHIPTPAQLEARAILEKMDKGKLAEAAGEQTESKPEPEKKRRRRSVSVVDFNLDSPIAPEIIKAGEDITVATVKKDNEDIKAAIKADTVITEIASTVQKVQEVSGQDEAAEKAAILPPKTEPIPGAPTPEELKGYRKRLLVFTENILPKAGMVPSEKIGGPTIKMRLYAMQRYKVLDIRHMTKLQWEEFLAFLESTTPAELIQIIDKAVGA